MMSLRVICRLGPPNQKSWLRLWGPLCEKWNPEPYVRTWRGKGRRAAHLTSGMAQQNLKKYNHYEPLWKVFE